MPQLNIHITPGFAEALEAVRRARGLRTKSETVRLVVQEAADRLAEPEEAYNFGRLAGLATRGAHSDPPRFSSHDDLWREH